MAYRVFCEREKRWITHLLHPDFAHKDILKKQIYTAKVKKTNYGSNISLEFKLAKGVEAYPIEGRVPLEMRAYQKEKAPLVFLLHVIDGYADEIEIFSADSSIIDEEDIALDDLEYVIKAGEETRAERHAGLFKIRYFINAWHRDSLETMDARQFDAEGGNVEGFIELNFNGNTYGFYPKTMVDGPEGGEWINVWLLSLLTSVIKLGSERYVAISDIESDCLWIKLIHKEGTLLASLLRTEDGAKIGTHCVQTGKRLVGERGDWYGVRVDMLQFRQEVVAKAQEYIDQVTAINPSVAHSASIRAMEDLIVRAKKVRFG